MNKKEDINKILSGLKEKPDFRMPEGYLDQFESELKLKLIKADKNSFRIPDGYGAESERKLKSISKRKSVITMKRTWIAAAAVVAVAAMVFFLRPVEEPCETFACLLEQAEITQEDIEYFEEYEEVSFYDEEY